jgi:hypothetical protein
MTSLVRHHQADIVAPLGQCARQILLGRFQCGGKCWLPLPEEFPHVGAIPLSPLGFHD